MSTFTDSKQEAAVLSTVTSFLKTVSSRSSNEEIKNYVLESEQPFVLPCFHTGINDTVGENGPGLSTEFKMIATGALAPEVFIYDAIAAVWAVVECSTGEDTLQYRGYTVFFLARTNGIWKISVAGRIPSSPEISLPLVNTSMTPELERLMHLGEWIFKKRASISLDDWALPRTRMVRNSIGGDLDSAVKQAQSFAATIPPETPWDEDFKDVTVRTAGDLGMLWMKFTLYQGDAVTTTGIDALLVKRKGSKWFFYGTQTLHEKKED